MGEPAPVLSEEERDKRLQQLYLELPEPTAFASKRQLSQKSGLKIPEVGQWLSGIDAYTLHKPVRKRFSRNVVHVTTKDEQWQADLVDVSSLSSENDSYRYLLTTIDVFSKLAFVIPLKTKTGEEVSKAFETIFKRIGRVPLKLQTDKGGEFRNKKVFALLKKYDIQYFVTQNPDTKASVIERFHRTLRSKMWHYFTHARTHRFIDVLEKLVDSYNNSYHRSIGMAPAQVSEDNILQVYNTLYANKNLGAAKRKPRFKIGETVRISKSKGTFERKFETGWTREIFRIKQVIPHAEIVYVVEDLNGTEITGTFYESELQAVKLPDTFQIDEILKTRRRSGSKEYLVRWLGYGDAFNSWVPEKDIVSLS